MDNKEEHVCAPSTMDQHGQDGSVKRRNDQLGDSEEASGDSGLSMVEVLEEEAQLEEDANAVLGGSDHRNCTYPLGYVQRQAVYACRTCQNDATGTAGICLACSYECHEGHDLIELYTKRLFRCDCGNERFTDNKCKLIPDKAPQNPDNKYNQNYRGLYCICNRPYPDPEDEVPDDMLQCVICEDWFHGRHLKSKVPEHNNYDEMTCTACMKRHEFLGAYTAQSSETIKLEMDQGNGSQQVSVECVKSEAKQQASCSAESSRENDAPNPGTKCETVNKQEVVTEGGPDGCCQLEQLKKGRPVPAGEGAVFWPSGWRCKLCTCDNCKKMYEDQCVSFLVELGDTVSAYEQNSKNTSSRYEQGMQQLTQMDRVQQVEIISSYNDMKDELKDYLKKFAENGKVVREEDIQEFFTKMKAKKRQRAAPSVQYFCR